MSNIGINPWLSCETEEELSEKYVDRYLGEEYGYNEWDRDKRKELIRVGLYAVQEAYEDGYAEAQRVFDAKLDKLYGEVVELFKRATNDE